MASPLKPTPTLNLSFGHLSSELLAIIFEQLRDVDSHSLESVRLASRRFDAIATPIVYQLLTLNERLVAPDAHHRYPTTFRHISVHTNHVVVPSNLDPEGITRIILGIQRLASIRWRFVVGDSHAAGIWLPSDVLNSSHKRLGGTKLHVENLPL
ncbi:hypothetical protein QQX98_007549, partial [Neonectria punicea]